MTEEAKKDAGRTEQTHTPGPLFVIAGRETEGGPDVWWVNAFPDGDEEGFITAEVYICRADADLYAAAPELLAACEAAERIMRAYIMPEHFDGHAAGALAVVRAAIAKAKGG